MICLFHDLLIRLNLFYKSNDRSPIPSCMERMKEISHYLMASNMLQMHAKYIDRCA